MVIGQTVGTTEVLVIGGGPGGYVAAIRAAQLGYSVILVDKAGELGGMCLHHGCIPSKALIHASEIYYLATHSAKLGINIGQVSLDFAKTQEWKSGVIKKLYDGLTTLCKKHNIRVIHAKAQFQGPMQVGLSGENLDFNAVEFRNCIIATGSKPRPLPLAPFSTNILSSKEALEIKTIPKNMCVIGGGYIGIELGLVYAKAGAKVTVIEGTSTILGQVEPELSAVATKRIKELGVELILNAKLESMSDTGTAAKVKVNGEEKEFEKVMVAVGHSPVTEGLQLDMAGIKVNERGFIEIDNQCKTSAPHIFAVGDVTGGMMLAHKASAQGRVAAEVIAGQTTVFEPRAIPAVIFSDPEIATVGLKEDEARKQFGEIRVGKFPFSALGKALTVDDIEGFMKIISDKNGVIVGVHAVGPSVTDFISEAALAIEMGATAEDLALTIHPHPTLPESLLEASEALLGRSIHIYQPKN